MYIGCEGGGRGVMGIHLVFAPPQVLDMCAAPGSKTAQLIEALHAQDTDHLRIPRE